MGEFQRVVGVRAEADLETVEEANVPRWLWRHVPDDDALAERHEDERYGSERSARQVFDRLSGTWTYWGWKAGYFDAEADARAFFDEMRYMLCKQIGAPNSPQWFNTGLHWAYGIDGPPQGHHYVDYETGELSRSKSEILFEELPQDDPTRRGPDISLAAETLGWKPTTALSDGLSRIIDYFRAFLREAAEREVDTTS